MQIFDPSAEEQYLATLQGLELILQRSSLLPDRNNPITVSRTSARES